MLWSAFVIGVFGSIHCLGMCGPIVLVLPASTSSRFVFFIERLLYNVGRACTYAFMGAVAGLLGKGIAMAGLQQWLGIVAGILMILGALLPTRAARRIIPDELYTRVLESVKARLGKLLAGGGGRSLFTIGLLNGFLPCGLVYVALAGSLIMGSPGGGALYMFIFGLGTLPVMLIASFASGLITGEIRKRVTRLIPVGMAVLGVLFILRGLSLGIPYLSPDMDKIKQRASSPAMIAPADSVRATSPGCCE
jgi:uncharacterized protein